MFLSIRLSINLIEPYEKPYITLNPKPSSSFHFIFHYPNFNPIYYSSFHFIFHYPNITPICCKVVLGGSDSGARLVLTGASEFKGYVGVCRGYVPVMHGFMGFRNINASADWETAQPINTSYNHIRDLRCWWFGYFREPPNTLTPQPPTGKRSRSVSPQREGSTTRG